MDMEFQPAPEVKGAGENALELKDAFDDFMQAFEAFKDSNDDRLGEIERKLTSDVVTEEKVARISQALDGQKKVLDRLVLKGRRPELGPSTGSDELRSRRASTRRRSRTMCGRARRRACRGSRRRRCRR